MNLTTIRNDIAARLATISSLHAFATVPASIVVPCAVVHVENLVPHQDLEGDFNLKLKVQLIVGLADWPTAQNQLDGYISSGQVVSAVETASTGSEDVTVMLIDNYGSTESADGTRYATVDFHLDVYV